MSLRLTCPGCGCQGDMAAFLVEDDAKRLIARFVGLDAALARAALQYLRLFKPARQALRLTRAAKLIDDLVELVEAGTVCKDERGNDRRAAPVEIWVAAIEQLLAKPPSGLPLANHHYLRSVVFGLAEQQAARAEAAQEEARKQVSHRRAAVNVAVAEDPVTNAIRYADRMLELGVYDQAQRDQCVADARAKAGA